MLGGETDEDKDEENCLNNRYPEANERSEQVRVRPFFGIIMTPRGRNFHKRNFLGFSLRVLSAVIMSMDSMSNEFISFGQLL